MSANSPRTITWSIPAPDGQTWDIPGPANATQEQLEAELLRQHPEAGIAKTTTPAPKEKPYLQRVNEAGDEFERTTGGGVMGVAKTGVAAGEVALEMFTGVAADVSGAVTSVISQNPELGKKVASWIQTHPATKSGQAAEKYFAEMARPIAEFLNIPLEKLEKSGHPILAQIGQVAYDLVGGEELRTAGRGLKNIMREATKPLAKTPAQRLAEMAGTESDFRETLTAARTEADQAKAVVEKMVPVKDPKTGKYTTAGPAAAAARQLSERASQAADALEEKGLYNRLFSSEPTDIASVKETLGKVGKYTPALADETMRRMGGEGDEFNAARFVRKYTQMPMETRWGLFGAARGSEYFRDMNALIDDVKRLGGNARAGKINMPPGLHHLDFTRMDIVIAAIVAHAGKAIGIPHMIGFGAGLFMGKPIERAFKNPQMVRAMRNTADTMLAVAAETGRDSLGFGIAGEQTGEGPSTRQ